jgi:hypothetical protein
VIGVMSSAAHVELAPADRHLIWQWLQHSCTCDAAAGVRAAGLKAVGNLALLPSPLQDPGVLVLPRMLQLHSFSKAAPEQHGSLQGFSRCSLSLKQAWQPPRSRCSLQPPGRWQIWQTASRSIAAQPRIGRTTFLALHKVLASLDLTARLHLANDCCAV